MRQIVASVLFFALVPSFWEQASPGDKTDEQSIRRAKGALASSLDTSLPNVTLENFLNYESEGADIHWEVNDCGEQTGNPATDAGRDFPMCVEADFDFRHQAVSVVIAVGTLKKGPSKPAFFSATVNDGSGKIRPLRRLGELPKELHRPVPKWPKTLPDTRVERS